MGNPDKKGYYRILGVDPSASAEAIKKAYRQRSKDLHPDTNKRLGAEVQFHALSEAYAVLSDPGARARYDTTGLEREAPGGAATGRDVGSPVPCSRCGRVSAQPRYIIFERAIGKLIRTAIDQVQGIYCSRCARDMAVTNSLLTWVLGPWSWNGPFVSAKVLMKNMAGGEQPKGPNHRLMVYQAQAFEAAGRADLARALAKDALSIDPDGEHAHVAHRIMGDGEVPTLKNQWGRDPLAVFAQLLPAMMLAVVFVVFVPGRPSAPPAPPDALRAPAPFKAAPFKAANNPPVTPTAQPAIDPNRAAHIKADGTILRAAPGDVQPAVATLSRFESVEKLNGLASTASWVRVRAGDMEGYVRSEQLGSGGGSQALAAWCDANRGERPASGDALLKLATGPHTLSATNRTGTDAVVKLKDDLGRTVLTFYLRAGESATVTNLPEGEFQPVFALGRRFSEACATFLDGLSAHAAMLPLGFESTIQNGKLFARTLSLDVIPGGGATVPIDPAVFAAD